MESINLENIQKEISELKQESELHKKNISLLQEQVDMVLNLEIKAEHREELVKASEKYESREIKLVEPQPLPDFLNGY